MGAHDSLERSLALVLVVGGSLFTLNALRLRPATSRTGRSSGVVPSATDATTPSVGRSLVVVMAGLSAGAAIIHLVAAPPHFAEIGDLAAGFVIAAIFQAAWIRWCLAGPSRNAIAVGIVANVAIVAAWAWTRTVGLPDAAGVLRPEAIGYADAASVVFEVLLVAALVVRWLGVDTRASAIPGARTAASIVIVPALSLVLVVTSLATAAIVTGQDHGLPGGAPMSDMEHAAAP
jgi:hypothetical protein